jgi:hypothetical protein
MNHTCVYINFDAAWCIFVVFKGNKHFISFNLYCPNSKF